MREAAGEGGILGFPDGHAAGNGKMGEDAKGKDPSARDTTAGDFRYAKAKNIPAGGTRRALDSGVRRRPHFAP